MMFLSLLLLLADPGGYRRQDTCERKPGRAQCAGSERVHDGRWKCKASCYTPGKAEDGGFKSHLIKAEGETEAACLKKLDEQASRGCQ